MLEMLSAPPHVQYSQVCPLGGHVRQAEKNPPKNQTAEGNPSPTCPCCAAGH